MALLLSLGLEISNIFIMKERNIALKLPMLPSAAQECYEKSHPTDTYTLKKIILLIL